MSFTESLKLPSRGVIYGSSDFDGTVSVKPFTTKLYKDLLQSNASDSGLKQFVDACLVDCPIKAKNLNQNDLLAILFKIRAITLGNKLKTQVKCPDCGHVEDVEWDLNATDVNYLYVDKYPIPLTLPDSQKEIHIRFPTGADVTKARQEADRRAGMFNKPASDFLQVYTVVSIIDVDNKDIVEKAEWYERLSPQDSIYIDEVISEMSDAFGVKLTQEAKCSSCDKIFTTYIDIWSDFFRSNAKRSLGITSKAGNLAGVVEESSVSE